LKAFWCSLLILDIYGSAVLRSPCIKLRLLNYLLLLVFFSLSSRSLGHISQSGGMESTQNDRKKRKSYDENSESERVPLFSVRDFSIGDILNYGRILGRIYWFFVFIDSREWKTNSSEDLHASKVQKALLYQNGAIC
jgi:hypothetical protein